MFSGGSYVDAEHDIAGTFDVTGMTRNLVSFECLIETNNAAWHKKIGQKTPGIGLTLLFGGRADDGNDLNSLVPFKFRATDLSPGVCMNVQKMQVPA